MKSKISRFILIIALTPITVTSQSLLDKLDAIATDSSQNVMSTFKGARISIGHSIETRKKNTLELSFMSRYWNVEQETSNSFVADRMCTRFGADYGITDNFTFGFGAGTPNGILDAYVKHRVIHQKVDDSGLPFGVTFLQSATYRTRSIVGIERRENFYDKLAFTTQLLIARKFSRKFSFQLAPTFIHRTSSNFSVDDHNHFALGFSPRYRVSNHVSIVSEYYYVANPLQSTKTYNAFALGVNWELSDTLLQFTMTNNMIFNEEGFITQTVKNFNTRNGNFFFGFNLIYHIQL